MLAERLSCPVQGGHRADNERLVRHRSFLTLRTALYGALCVAGLSATAFAQSDAQSATPPLTPTEVANLRAEILRQQEQIKQQQQQLYIQGLRLNDQQNLLNAELSKLRGTGIGSPAGATAPPTAAPAGTNTAQASPTPVQETPVPAPAGTPAGPANGGTQAAPITGPSQTQKETQRVLQTAPELSSKGGVLTPKGYLVVDPSLEYDYWDQNQVNISGFTIVPGVTFGNINVQKVQANYLTTALTFRYGITNRWEVNTKIPVVYATGSTTTQPLGPNAEVFSPGADAFNIGDIQIGTSYQFNTGNKGWPIFLGNLLFKTTTGVSPFDVPIYTTNDPNGLFIAGIDKKLPTGTGFYSLEPNVTVLFPTSPAVLFANVLYGINFSRTVDLANRAGGPGTSTDISPGNYISGTFGVGFAVNDQTSMTFSYQQEHVWPTSANGTEVAGSSFDFGTFNFGLGYALTKNVNLNLGAGIGVGPNSPAAKILLEVPIRFGL
jgi:hypothetical protein